MFFPRQPQWCIYCQDVNIIICNFNGKYYLLWCVWKVSVNFSCTVDQRVLVFFKTCRLFLKNCPTRSEGRRCCLSSHKLRAKVIIWWLRYPFISSLLNNSAVVQRFCFYFFLYVNKVSGWVGGYVVEKIFKTLMNPCSVGWSSHMVTDQAYWPRVFCAVRQFSPPFAVCLGVNDVWQCRGEAWAPSARILMTWAWKMLEFDGREADR